MKIILTKKPKNVTIIEGFPGFGLIGTISIEFLMDHLKTEKIGNVEMEEIPAMIAILFIFSTPFVAAVWNDTFAAPKRSKPQL